MGEKLNFKANCQTTAMGIMPHTDIEKALQLSLSLDIPYFPQLPNVSYYEDMYVQASEHFPGIIVDVDNQRISFDSVKFSEDLEDYSQKMSDPSTYSLTEKYSAVYHRFLSEDLSGYTAIRGQVVGPVSFGFKVFDENKMPIIYNESIRTLLYDFLGRKINQQVAELMKSNKHAFVWLDEPGLGWVFSGLSGYDDTVARRDYAEFIENLDGPGALHLCANVNLPYLLSLGTAILSFDAYQIDVLPRGYADAVADYLRAGGVISWGIIPTDSSSLSTENPESLTNRLLEYWNVIAENTTVPVRQIAEQALIAPARCCLKNSGLVGAIGEFTRKIDSNVNVKTEEEIVETAFAYMKTVSGNLRERFTL